MADPLVTGLPGGGVDAVHASIEAIAIQGTGSGPLRGPELIFSVFVALVRLRSRRYRCGTPHARSGKSSGTCRDAARFLAITKATMTSSAFVRTTELSGRTFKIDIDAVLAEGERVVVLCTVSAERHGRTGTRPRSTSGG